MATPAELRDRLWRQAREYLEDATTLPLAEPLLGYSLRLRLWKTDIFAACCSWSLFAPSSRGTANHYHVRRVVWHQPEDAKRPRAGAAPEADLACFPSPTMSHADGVLLSSEVGAMMAAGMGIWIPVAGQNGGIWTQDWPCGGGETGYEEPGNKLRLVWTGCPESWQAFAEWAEMFIGLLNRACDAQPNAGPNERERGRTN